ncbi:hypothetical protein BRM3_02240 [Brachybacterium huguangmaarense]|uniref:Nudix hydrolase domain-containing protein n=1 Tax=Brachybacterium huguangmaarense TaxID=1652028 RepID=A0ABY6G242_9MICO|nr:hypothetical protein [Brachybacterium huguangmaarense]UYG17275.1 hypothetical protein BRM3_02240 [Brachybacterium huguangmaarense]
MSWLRLHQWLVRPFALLLLSGALLWSCSMLFYDTDDGSFARELISSVIGTILTLAAAGLVALFALRHRLASRREKQIVRRFSEDSWKTRALTVGEMTIPHMSIVVSCTQGVPWTRRASCTYTTTGARRSRHPAVDAVREEWLQGDRERADALGLMFVDLDAADLLDASLELRVENGRRVPHYSFTLGTTTYFEFASTALKLDRTLVADDGSERSLRDVLGCDPHSVLDVGELPIPATIGSGTVAVTSNNRVLLSVRLRTFVAGPGDAEGSRRPVHVVAEGLIPTDVDDDGNFSPIAGARRALREELHVGPRSDHIAKVTDLIEVGFAFDHQRWQPYFVFLARLDRTWAEIQPGVHAATDSWESAMLISLPFDIEHAGLRLLLQGRHPEFQLASNHATAGLWFALLYQHGFEQMRDELSSTR